MKKSEQLSQPSARALARATRQVTLLAAPIVLIQLLIAQNSYADAGTPLMWMAAGHLIFGNAIIGFFEGLILALLFRSGFVRCILIVVLANYISMAAGMAGVVSLEIIFDKCISIDGLLFSIVTLAAVSFVVTVVIEWPFYYWALKGVDRRRKRALIGCTLVNAASYILLVPIYLSVSATSLISEAKVVGVASMAQTNKAQVYYLSENMNELLRIRLDGTNGQEVMAFPPGVDDRELVICSVGGKPVIAVQWTGKEKGLPQEVRKVVVDSIPGLVASCDPCESLTRQYLRAQADLRAENERDWDVRTGFWAGDGLTAVNVKAGKKLWFALETPLVAWPFGKPSILPGDQVICQLGRQIVLVDLNTSRIALIAWGSSPVVVLEK
jgi:hypothetical protein